MEKLHVRFAHEPCEILPGRWQVVGWRGDRSFLLDSGLTKAQAVKAVRVCERVGLFCGAVISA